jgi:hypothetical protein
MTRPLLSHRPVNLTACLMATILAAAILAPGGAAAATAALSGPSRFLITDCNALTLTLRFTADAEPLAIRTNDATATGSSAPVGWTIDWDKPRLSNADIKEYTSTGALKSTSGAVGAYAAPLLVTFTGSPPAPLAITLIRTAEPVLDAPTSVTSHGTRGWERQFRRGQSIFERVRPMPQSTASPRLGLSSGTQRASPRASN